MAQDRKTPPPDGPRAGEKFIFPSVRKNDPEDVSWALSTAEAMWNRGDHVEAVKWIRRAAEAASECDADARALELAKAAADLSTQLEAGDRPTTLAPPPAKLVHPQTSPPPLLKRALAPVAKTPATPAVKELAGRSPAPARVSPSVPPPSRQAPGGRPLEAKRRRSQTNLGDEARAAKNIRVAAGDLDATAEVPASSATTTPIGLGPAVTPRTSVASGPSDARKRGRSRPAVEELAGPATEKVKNPLLRMSGDPDAWPTQAYGDELDELEGEHTRIGTPAYVENAKAVSSAPGPMADAAPAVKPSQAVRVVVWRDQDGVRVAPQGTAVSAISIDAVLVALDPTADLASWLVTLEKLEKK